ncbi:RNA 2',3'-cyclic phosphodiesterase [Candidatus Peregrinibacteria bacterium]|nr:RNA 2',3'-cyclic phosphodiesterase [Candidatus Peregrinibacteria bacterium]
MIHEIAISPARRLFLAIPLPKSIAEILLQCRFQHPAIRWTPPANFHITVYFFGATPENSIRELAKHIRAVSSSVKSFEMDFEKFICVPQGISPHMIWAGLQSNSHFSTLVKKIQNIAIELLHVKPENHAPHPHVTLARFRARADVREIPLAKLDIPPLQVKNLHLMESHLERSGAQYSLLSKFALKYTENIEVPEHLP